MADPQLTIYDFGCTDYGIIWQLQQELVQRRIRDEMPDILLLGEHPPVITAGRGGHADNVIDPKVPVIDIERGGDVTYHAPGQLIAYPIMKLPVDERDLHAYLRKLEETLILTLRDYGLWGIRNKGFTGVWVLDQSKAAEDAEIRKPRKIASVGVAVKQWVTYHGIALNVSTDLSGFSQINPCGLSSEVMTSMQEQLDRPMSSGAAKNAVKHAFSAHFQAVFGYANVLVPENILLQRP